MSEVNGNVLIDQGNGWKSASVGIDLYTNDKIKTEDGNAIVVLYESVLVTLKPKTEVEIKDLDKENLNVKQNSGTTWNKFTGLSGVESYQVETPNTVAAVRGTGWELNAEKNQIIVSDGKVDYKYGDKEISVNALEKYILESEKLLKKDLTADERARLKEHLNKDVETLKGMRWDEVNKNKWVYEMAKKRFNFDDAMVQKFFDETDKGEVNEDEILNKVPIKVEGFLKIIAINKKIREILKLIESI